MKVRGAKGGWREKPLDPNLSVDSLPGGSLSKPRIRAQTVEKNYRQRALQPMS
jgi:hypothetical protein